MPTIQERAKEIREAKALIKSKEQQYSEQVKFRLEALKKEFEVAFAEVLPLIIETGVAYSANFQGRHEHMGAYIEFEYEGRVLKMDFFRKDAYRYMYVPYSHKGNIDTICKKYPLDDFILWIDEELVSKSK